MTLPPIGEQYISLPTQPQNKHTPYYNVYDQQANGNIAETENMLTQYNQTTQQTQAYDLEMSFPVIDDLFTRQQIITNVRPISLTDVNAIAAAQRANYAVQERQFGNNIKAGVDFLLSPQIEQIQMTTTPMNAFQTPEYDVATASIGTVAGQPFDNFDITQSGMRIYGQQDPGFSTEIYDQAPTQTQVISPEWSMASKTLTTPEGYKYLGGFKRFKSLPKTREHYEKITQNIEYNYKEIPENQLQQYIQSVINQFQLQGNQFEKDYLKSVIIGKINGVDITNAWEENDFFKGLPADEQSKLHSATASIISVHELKQKIIGPESYRKINTRRK